MWNYLAGAVGGIISYCARYSVTQDVRTQLPPGHFHLQCERLFPDGFVVFPDPGTVFR